MSTTSSEPEKKTTKAEKMHAQKFCIEVARTFLSFGAPAHHLEAQLKKAAHVLEIDAEFLLLPNTVFVSFYDAKNPTDAGGLHAIKQVGSLSITQLRKTYSIYKKVVSEKIIGPEKGWQELETLQISDPPHSDWIRIGIAFLCGAVITCLAFDGSLLDAFIAGIAQGILAALMFKMVGSEPVIARIFEYDSQSFPNLLIIRVKFTLFLQTFCNLSNFFCCPRYLLSLQPQSLLFSSFIRRNSLDTSWICS